MTHKQHSRIFKYHPSKKCIGKGGYGIVKLINVPERELYKNQITCRKRRRNGLRKKNKTIPVARKTFIQNGNFAMEMHNHDRIPENLRDKYFVHLHRGYKRKITHRVMNMNDGSIFKSSVVEYCIEMAYLAPNQWYLLCQYQFEDIHNILHQLIHCQLDLIRVGGIYYDMSPYNVFVCKNTGKIKLIDFGALFFPLHVRELYEELSINYKHQNVQNPLYVNIYPQRTKRNKIIYDNYYFGGQEKLLKKKIDPNPIIAFFGLVTTICTCLYANPNPKKNCTKIALQLLLDLVFTNTDNSRPINVRDLMNNSDHQKKLINILLDNPTLVDQISLYPK